MIRSRKNRQHQLTVIVPIYNEAESLPGFLPKLMEICLEHEWRLVLVNDGSTDGSGALIAPYENLPAVRIVHHKVNRGYGGALKSGIMISETPYTITLDGDGQHNPEDIQRILNFAIEHDADMVVGNRGRGEKASPYREIGKSIIRRFTRFLMSLPVHDLNSGFKLYRTELVQQYLSLCPNSMAFSDVITLVFISQRNLVLEHPITINERARGRSTISIYTALETIIEILNIAMMFNPLRIFLPLSAACVSFGILWGIPFLLLDRGVSVGAMLAIVTGLLFFFIGLVASQLSAIRIASLNKPK